MTAPAYVPSKAIDDTRIYRSPPRRPAPWIPSRPAELATGQPRGKRFGSPGPDQGFALSLAERFRDQLVLRAGEHQDDAIAGAVAVALTRASRFGRAPVIHDLTVAFTLWGYLDDPADDELVAVRRTRFEGVADPHHYMELRAIVDAVPESTVRLSPAELKRRHADDWASLLAL